MKCPSCAAKAAAHATECPSCGLVFAKWHARQKKAKHDAAAALAALEAPEAFATPAPDLRKGRIVAGVLVVLWIGGLAYYYHRRLAPPPWQPGAPTGEFAQYRDRKTGEIVRMPIRRVDGAPRPPEGN